MRTRSKFMLSVAVACLAGLLTYALRSTLATPDARAQEIRAQEIRAQEIRARISKRLEAVAAMERAGIEAALAASSAQSSDTFLLAESETQPPAKAVPAADTEWSSLPRVTWIFAEQAIRFPRGIKARELFRHPELNPADAYISEPARKLLEQLVESAGACARDVNESISRVRRAEADQLIAIGNVTELDPANLQDKSIRKAVKSGMMISKRGKKVYQVPRSSLTESTSLQVYANLANQEFGARVVYWFVGMGLCPESHSEELLTQLFKEN